MLFMFVPLRLFILQDLHFYVLKILVPFFGWVFVDNQCVVLGHKEYIHCFHVKN